MISKRVTNMCSLKVSVYQPGLIIESEQRDVSVRVVSIGQTSWTGSQRYFDQLGYCMSVPCDSSSRVYFFAKRNKDVLTPAESDDVNNGVRPVQDVINYMVINSTWVNFNINPTNLPQNGPIYLNTGSVFDSSSLACDAAPTTANHFRVYVPTSQPNSLDNAFAFNTVNQFYDDLDTFPAFPANGSQQCSITDRYLQWYPWKFYRQQNFRVFFLKVSLPNMTNTQYRIQYIARAIDEKHPFRGQIYGVRQIVIDTRVEHAACIEIRRPEKLNICDDEAYEIDEDYTRLELSVTSHDMIVSEIRIINDATIVRSNVGDAALIVDLSSRDFYSNSQGIYRASEGTRDEAFSTARYRCMDSSDRFFDATRTVTLNTQYAVKFAFN